jgi:dihydroneopterin aldolase
MDTIFISDLRIETRIGIYEWEKHVRQPVLLNIEIAMPHSRAGTTDDFSDALDYAAVVNRLQEFVSDHPHELVERLAEEIAALISFSELLRRGSAGAQNRAAAGQTTGVR